MSSKGHMPNLSPRVSDEIRKTTCYMCACRCGINVHMLDGKVRYIEGNRDHPINRGVLCAKGSAGIMQHYSPARLKKPLMRTGERGSGDFKEIEWEEALGLAASWLDDVRQSDPRKLAFFTGRDQSQSMTGWWAQQFGTPNYAAHGGFCSVNMAAAGIYTMGGAFWEFGAPDWDRTELHIIFGVAEDHDSNPIKMGLGKLKARGVKVIGVNPVRTGYNAIADEWLGITPGTDGLLILALVHELIRTGRVDLDYLIRYTNAPWLVIDDPEAADHGLFARDAEGVPMVAERGSGMVVPSSMPGVKPALQGRHRLADGRSAVPVFELMAGKYADARHSPAAVAGRTGIDAATISRIADEIAAAAFDREVVIDQPWTDMKGERHERMIGRPVTFHAMRGISAHANGFQTCRALHLLQILIGSIDCPGGFRFKPPYPRPVAGQPKPHGGSQKCTPLNGPHLGYPRGPEDMLLEADGLTPQRLDKAFSWDAPLSAHGLMHMVISNAHARDPYGIDVLFMYMANMAWNSSMNTSEVMRMLTDKDDKGEYVIPKIIYSDAYSSEMVAYADLILPDTTYLERHDSISLLDRPISEPEAMCDSIRWPVVEPDRDVRGFQSVLLDLGHRLGLPAMTNKDGKPVYRDYADYIVNHQRKPGIGPLSGWRGADGTKTGRGEPNPDQLARYIENGGFSEVHIPAEARFFKHANRAWSDWAIAQGLQDGPVENVFQLYLEPLRKFQLAAEGKAEPQPPEHHRARIRACFDPLPVWYAPFGDAQQTADYPLHALTQRPAAMYHSWGSQNAWLRQIHGTNPLFVPGTVCDAHGLADGDWALVSSPNGEIRVPVARMDALNGSTVWTWNAIGKRKGAWALDPKAQEAGKGFLLNHLIGELLPPKGDGMRWSNSDPITGQAAWFDLRVAIRRDPDQSLGRASPDTGTQKSPVGTGPETVTYGREWTE
ncbi:molybdopterin-dependent oxidoreductase iron-sulfur protein [Hoeflea marina]|uniref:Molybdopterin-dependent oxidoreductase iron-sulfur protein n=1 Tax=Hoeflea marina TaxID=274592 RepID=A0A317PIL2_9HYPH|nr:molybdopterin oxidoreductase family protein [Hoeflea marina]PWW00439.1 molybdopterin-dependent oxidoreductase iron-sulfur protein [Hoeflea marina]